MVPHCKGNPTFITFVKNTTPKPDLSAESSFSYKGRFNMVVIIYLNSNNRTHEQNTVL